MNKQRILKGLLWITQESGGLGPAQLDIWLGELKKAGYIDFELRKVDDCRLPFAIITDAGRDKLK
jgi:hypothetical protein